MSMHVVALRVCPGMPAWWRRSTSIGVGGWAWMLFVSLPVEAQVVSGRVIDDGTGEAIAGAELLLLGQDERTAARAVSTDNGTFTLRPDEHGWYRLNARRLGYATTTSAPLDLVESESLDVEFRMAAEAIPLAPLTVVGRQRRPEPRDPRLERWDYYERKEFYGERSGFGHFIEGEDLRQSAFRITNMIQDVPGVRFTSSGGRFGTVTNRRGRPCRFYLNGFRTPEVDDIPVSSVIAIEVYPGMVGPLRFGGGGCSVLVWTGIRP